MWATLLFAPHSTAQAVERAQAEWGLGAGCEAAVEMGTQRGSARLGCGRGQRTLWRMAAKDRVAMPLDEFQTPLMSFRHLFLHLSLEQG